MTNKCCEDCYSDEADCPEACECHSTTKQGWEERFDKTLNAIEKFYSEPVYGSELIRDFIASEIEKAQVEVLDEVASKVENWHYKKGGYSELAHQIRTRFGGAPKQSEV